MSFLLITRGGIYRKRGQSTKCSWTAASRKVIDPLQEEIGTCLSPLLITSRALWEFPTWSHRFPKTWAYALRTGCWVGADPHSWRVSSAQRISMRTTDHFNPTAFLNTLSDTKPRGGPWRLMFSTDSVYLWKLHQHVQNVGPPPATSLSHRLYPAHFPDGDPEGAPASLTLLQLWVAVLKRLLITASISACLPGEKSLIPFLQRGQIWALPANLQEITFQVTDDMTSDFLMI